MRDLAPVSGPPRPGSAAGPEVAERRGPASAERRGTAHAERRGPRAAPGLDALVHPMPLLALAVLLMNDHVLKPNVPGLVSGKLSGIAVLVLLPFLLLAAWEVARFAWPRMAAIGPRLVVASVAVTMAAYVAIEVVPLAGDAYRVGLGGAQWVFGAVIAAVGGGAAPALAPVLLWSDPTDLLVVPVPLVVLAVGPYRGRRQAGSL